MAILLIISPWEDVVTGTPFKAGRRFLLVICLIHVCLYVSLCVHGTTETLDGVAELPDARTQTDVKEMDTYSENRETLFL